MKKTVLLRCCIFSMLFSGVADAREITPDKIDAELSNIPNMALHVRSEIDKSLEVQHLATYHKSHPVVSRYPYLRAKISSKCVDTSYNPAALFVSIATFPMAVVGQGGGWRFSLGTTKCKNDSKIETKVAFSVVESLKETDEKFEINCGTDPEATKKCLAFAESRLAIWRKDAPLLSVEKDKATNDKLIADYYSKFIKNALPGRRP